MSDDVLVEGEKVPIGSSVTLVALTLDYDAGELGYNSSLG